MRVWTLLAAILMSGLTLDGVAQAQSAATGGARTVGVIDMGHILQNHPTLKSRLDTIKSQMEAADKNMQAKRESIVKQMETLKERYNEGTPEFDRAEKQIAEMDTDFRLELVKKRKEFETAQAEVLYDVHSSITQLLKYLNEQMGVQVVLQVSRQQVDKKKPETLDIAMSQNVLYFDKSVDLTDWVLEALNKQMSASRQAAPAR